MRVLMLGSIVEVVPPIPGDRSAPDLQIWHISILHLRSTGVPKGVMIGATRSIKPPRFLNFGAQLSLRTESLDRPAELRHLGWHSWLV